MLTRFVLFGALALGPLAARAPQGRIPPALERLALLAGDWSVVDGAGAATDLRATYRLVAGGTAVTETLMVGRPEETVTIYHREGERVTATLLSARGGPLRLLPADSNDPDLVRFVLDEGKAREGRVREVRLTLLGGDRLRVGWTVASREGEGDEHVFELERARTVEELATEVARLRRGLDSVQEELDLRLEGRVRVERRGEPAHTLLETRTLASGPGWNVSGVPFRVFQHDETIPFASTYAAQGDGGLTVARVVGGRWADHPRAFEWDLAHLEGHALRLVLVDAVTDHYGQVAVSEISILEEAPE